MLDPLRSPYGIFWELTPFHRSLAVIHSAPERWTVEQTQRLVRAANSQAAMERIEKVLLTDWKKMSAAERVKILDWRERHYTAHFVKQEGEDGAPQFES